MRNQKVERPSQGSAVASASKVIIRCVNDTYNGTSKLGMFSRHYV